MIEILPMRPEYLDAVCDVEEACFPVPWSRESLESDIAKPESLYFVAVLDGKVIGFAGMWHVVNEGHVTNIAVLPEHRRVGAGTRLLDKLIETAGKLEMIGILLEVRSGNYAAQRLYFNRGFTLERIRKNYYSDTAEDGYVLWKNLAIANKEGTTWSN